MWAQQSMISHCCTVLLSPIRCFQFFKFFLFIYFFKPGVAFSPSWCSITLIPTLLGPAGQVGLKDAEGSDQLKVHCT